MFIARRHYLPMPFGGAEGVLTDTIQLSFAPPNGDGFVIDPDYKHGTPTE